MTTGIMPQIMLAQSIKAYSHSMRFHFGPLLRAFSNGCVFDENAYLAHLCSEIVIYCSCNKLFLARDKCYGQI